MSGPLKDLLAQFPSGPVPAELVPALERLLAEEWLRLGGSADGGMQAPKLINRVETPTWNPPCLEFVIERHGAVVNSGTRAELQRWRVDVEARTAEIVETRRRQLRRAAARVSVQGDAEEVAAAILAGTDSPLLKRYPDGRIRVLIGAIIPDSGYQQTVAGRRRRFRKALEEQLKTGGWEPTGFNVYRRNEIPAP